MYSLLLRNWWIKLTQDSDLEAAEEKTIYCLKRMHERITYDDALTMQMLNVNSGQCNTEIVDEIPEEADPENPDNIITNCYKTKGVITSIIQNAIKIDDKYNFDLRHNTAERFNKLAENDLVEFMVYETVKEKATAIKLLNILESEWNEQSQDQTISNNLPKIAPPSAAAPEDSASEQRVYYQTQTLTIVGEVFYQSPQAQFVHVETTFKRLVIDLARIPLNFVPLQGDKLSLRCQVQINWDAVSSIGEVLEIVAVQPLRCMYKQRCRVTYLYRQCGILDKSYACLKKHYPGAGLQIGDEVIADIIESETHKWFWRVIRCQPVITAVLVPITNPDSDFFVVTISDDIICTCDLIRQVHRLAIDLSSNVEFALQIVNVSVDYRLEEVRSINVIHPLPGDGLNLKAGGKEQIHIEMKLRCAGLINFQVTIKFEKFQVKRTILVAVGKNAQDLMGQFNLTGLDSIAKLANDIRANVKPQRRELPLRGSHKTLSIRFDQRKVGSYEVPRNLEELCAPNATKEPAIILKMFPCISSTLTPDNYIKKFTTLLWIEEMENVAQFRSLDMDMASFKKDGQFLSLDVESIIDNRITPSVGDIVRIIPICTRDTTYSDGIIQRVHSNRILIKFESYFHKTYNGEDYRVQFNFSRFQFRKMHHAISRAFADLGIDFLFPRVASTPGCPQNEVELNATNSKLVVNGVERKWFNPGLNIKQMNAVVNVLRAENLTLPYVIFGPPGTGKTVTISELVLQIVTLYRHARVLVATPSNSAANLITVHVANSGVLRRGDFLRLCSQNVIDREYIPKNVLPYCALNDSHNDYSTQELLMSAGAYAKLKNRCLSSHRLIIGTCSVLGNFLAMDLAPDHFTHIIVDEVGQCTEPSIMQVLSQITGGKSQVILAGDPQQLQPICVSNFVKQHGLAISFLERVMQLPPYAHRPDLFPDSNGYNPQCVTKLLVNYRSLPSILKIYNDLFYKSELIPAISSEGSEELNELNKLSDILVRSKHRKPDHGTFFYGVCSENRQENESTSWFNLVEAKKVYDFTMQLLGKDISADNIGIITPYMSQIKYLRQLFQGSEMSVPKIGTVEEFQGQERSIILITTVRSTKRYEGLHVSQVIGFLQCPKRMNVAISRARSFVCVFGDPFVLQMNDMWRSYILYCIKNDAYMGCSLSMPLNS